ncbi:MAG TPA: hypothetical protein VFG05_06730 [Methylocella sp.]|nr:hypothetical protein [Methylocella sp.]
MQESAVQLTVLTKLPIFPLQTTVRLKDLAFVRAYSWPRRTSRRTALAGQIKHKLNSNADLAAPIRPFKTGPWHVYREWFHGQIAGLNQRVSTAFDLAA